MTRQYLANVFQDEVLEYSKAFDDEDPVRMKALRGRTNGIFKDMDALLACERFFPVGRMDLGREKLGRRQEGEELF